jgi:hypothetical protein
MSWLRFAVAGSVLVAVACAIGRARRAERGVDSAPHQPNANVEADMEDQAMARAVSEVNSGEYDMQG